MNANRSDHSIAISPIGDFDPVLVARLCETVHQAFGIPATPHPLLDDILFAWNPGRRQYHSTPVLEKLSDAAPPWALKVIALVKVDLFIPILTYVYGEAQLKGRACIVSTYRLNEALPPLATENIFEARVAKEVIHELGHTFDLRHCDDPTCIMHYCRTESDVDRKSDQLCRYCQVLLSDEFKRIKKDKPSRAEK